jgi:uncharacterized protein (TIGR00369 family)
MNLEELQKSEIGFLSHIGGELIDFSEGYAELAFEIDDFHKQHLGVVHGGAIATLADHAGWYAAVSQIDIGQTCVTIELKINYLKPAFEELLKAQARVINRTRKTVFVVIELFDKDKIVAYSTATYSVITDKRNSKC